MNPGPHVPLASEAVASGGVWLAVLLPLLWGLLSPPSEEPTQTPWSWGKDLGLAALMGVVSAALCGWWLSRFYLVEGPYLVSDFHDYCSTLLPQATGDIEALTKSRGRWAAAMPSALVEEHGIIDALAWGGVLGTAGIGAGLTLWGRAVHGRVAGVAAALAMGTLPELATFSRTLSFYPEITAGLALATGAAAVALRFPGIGTLLLGALGVGLAFLIDLRGLVWGLTCGGIVLLACFRGPWKQWPVKLVIFGLVLNLAWRLGPVAYQPQMNPLEGHVDLVKRMEDNGIPVPTDFPDHRTAYVWGRTPLSDIPDTLLALRAQSAAVPEAMRDVRGGKANRQQRVEPWAVVGPGAGLLALLGLLRGREKLARAVVLVGLAAPWIVSLQGTIAVQRSFPRFLGSAWPVLALALGLALATLSSLPTLWASRAPELPEWTRWLKPVGAGLIAVLLVLGVVPSHLAPDAPWKVPLTAANNQIWKVEDWKAGTRMPIGRERDCYADLLTLEARGIPWRGTLFGGVPER